MSIDYRNVLYGGIKVLICVIKKSDRIDKTQWILHNNLFLTENKHFFTDIGRNVFTRLHF
jgi:hypothetical protein